MNQSSPGKRESLDTLVTSNSKKTKGNLSTSGEVLCEGEKSNFHREIENEPE